MSGEHAEDVGDLNDDPRGSQLQHEDFQLARTMHHDRRRNGLFADGPFHKARAAWVPSDHHRPWSDRAPCVSASFGSAFLEYVESVSISGGLETQVAQIE